MISNKELFNLEETIAKELFEKYEYPYEVISNIKNYIMELQAKLDKDKYNFYNDVVIAKDADVSDKAVILGPTIIDSSATIRPFAYIRGNAIIGKNCVIGNSTEIKNAILFNNSQAPHFNYIGDSILGYKAHIGAGVILSNLKSDNSNIKIKYKDQMIDTHLRKLGAIIGDNVEVGCNSVLNPGTIIGNNTHIYPLSSVRDFVEKDKIYKNCDNIVDIK